MTLAILNKKFIVENCYGICNYAWIVLKPVCVLTDVIQS